MSAKRRLTSSRNISPPGNRERAVIAGLLVTGVLITAAVLALRTKARTENLNELYKRVIVSSSSFINPDIDTEKLFDRKISSAWSDEISKNNVIAPGQFRPSVSLNKPLPDPDSLYIVLEVGLTHFPDTPPRPNPLKEFWIWPGNQKNMKLFRAYARPRKIHLIFFRQKLVDMDREYRIPGAPQFWAARTIELEDRPYARKIDLDFLEQPGDSPRFPVNIDQIWLRIVIETFYPGDIFPNRVAISEIDFRETHRTHEYVSDNRVRREIAE